MYYRRDLPKRLPISRLQVFRRQEHEHVNSTWKTFWEKTTIHGVRNTSDPTMEVFERYVKNAFFLLTFLIIINIRFQHFYVFLYYIKEKFLNRTYTVYTIGYTIFFN